MLACGSCNMLLCGLVGGFDSALHASANSFFHNGNTVQGFTMFATLGELFVTVL
jgi:hypothetical protein